MKEYNEWKARSNNLIIGQVLRFEKGLDRNKVVTKALDGTPYIQTIGTGIPYAEITLFCNITERDYVNRAEATGELVSVVYRDHIYYGYFEEEPDWSTDEPGMYYEAELKLLIDSQEEV